MLLDFDFARPLQSRTHRSTPPATTTTGCQTCFATVKQGPTRGWRPIPSLASIFQEWEPGPIAHRKALASAWGACLRKLKCGSSACEQWPFWGKLLDHLEVELREVDHDRSSGDES